ncbi:Metalloprotease [Marasmius fiardii PR-910]|nr:Metalloprotease [Marasmius fiardii PR-910]
MLVASFIAIALTSFALAGPMKRPGSLTVSLSGPNAVESVDELKFMAAVKNTGSDQVKILKFGTILDDKFPTRSFTVTKDGATVPFTGVKLSVSLKHAGDNAYTVIPAGENVTVYHDVAALFDFASVGAGTFKFSPVTTFQLAEVGRNPNSFGDSKVLEIDTNPVEVVLTGELEKQELVPLEKRARNICSTDQAAFLVSAQMAGAAASYVSRYGADDLFNPYFGTNPTSKVEDVLKVANENDSSRTLDCSDPYNQCDPTLGVLAYTHMSRSNNVYFCSVFFDYLVPQNRVCDGSPTVDNPDTRGATVLHELTHAASATNDVAYDCEEDETLPDWASVQNTDSYGCFCSQVWEDTAC